MCEAIDHRSTMKDYFVLCAGTGQGGGESMTQEEAR